MKLRVNKQIREVPLGEIPSLSEESRRIFLREGAKPPKSIIVLNKKYIERFGHLVETLKNAQERGAWRKVFGLLRSLFHLGLVIVLFWGLVQLSTIHPASGITLGICGFLIIFGMGLYSTTRYYNNLGKVEPKLGVGKIPFYIFAAFCFPTMEEFAKVPYLEKVVERETKEFEQAFSEVTTFFQKDTTLLKNSLVSMIEKLENSLEDASHLPTRNEIREEEMEATLNVYKFAFQDFNVAKSFYIKI